MDKEYLYVGHYYDSEGNYILKVGTTNDLNRRQKEHNRKYSTTPNHPFAADGQFIYDWHRKLSKYNTLRYEDRTKKAWKQDLNGVYIRNDRFVFAEKPPKVYITIRKTYEIVL